MYQDIFRHKESLTTSTRGSTDSERAILVIAAWNFELIDSTSCDSHYETLRDS